MTITELLSELSSLVEARKRPRGAGFTRTTTGHSPVYVGSKLSTLQPSDRVTRLRKSHPSTTKAQWSAWDRLGVTPVEHGGELFISMTQARALFAMSPARFNKRIRPHLPAPSKVKIGGSLRRLPAWRVAEIEDVLSHWRAGSFD